MAAQNMLLDPGVPGLARLRPQGAGAVIAVELVQRRGFEALSEARPQYRLRIVESPGCGDRTVRVGAELVLPVIPLAGGQGEAAHDLALQLRVAAVDRLIRIDRHRTAEIIGGRVAVDGGALVLGAEYGLIPRGELPGA